MADIRQRKAAPSDQPGKPKPVPKEVLEKEDGRGLPILDILRALVFALLASSALSYFVTGESFLWGVQRPQWTRLDVVKAYIVRLLSFPPSNHNSQPQSHSHSCFYSVLFYSAVLSSNHQQQSGPKQYTDSDLAAYDGTNPDLPILLAINGTIFDVSRGRKFYGPGGSYSFFAGADASRAFVTNCFQEDRNPDLRGAELAFIPKDSEVDALYTSGELVRIYPFSPLSCSSLPSCPYPSFRFVFWA